MAVWRGEVMRIVTPATLAAEAPARWAQQYANTANMHHKTITVRLRDLGPSPTPQQVNETIGNDSWTAVPDCDECGKLRPPMVVMVGEEPDYESRTAYLCGACIGKLARLIAHPTQPEPPQ